MKPFGPGLPENAGKEGGPKSLFDPDNGYRNHSKAVWGR